MTKRAAMLMAAGLVAALAAGATALSFGLGGNGPVQAETRDPKPIVRTVHRTVTVEKPAKGADQPVQVIQVASAPASGSSSSDDAFEEGSEDGEDHEAGDDHEDDDDFEDDDDHEDDD